MSLIITRQSQDEPYNYTWITGWVR